MPDTTDANPVFNDSAKQFWVIGFPIKQSKSPLIHNTGYTAAGLPHKFDIHEVRSLGPEIGRMFADPIFGGAAITMPFKVDVMQFIDEKTASASVLGACNTIIPSTKHGSPILIGDNTDWLGMHTVLQKGLLAAHRRQIDDPALIIGAGGAARAGIYALGQLGVKYVYLYNRTHSKIGEIIRDFANYPIEIIPIYSLVNVEFAKGDPIFVVGTVPAKGTSITGDGQPSDNTIQLSAEIFKRHDGGVMLDMAYLPKRTPLIKLAEQNSSWVTNPGIDVLLGQGFAQFKIWTGVDPATELITEAVLAQYEKEQAAISA